MRCPIAVTWMLIFIISQVSRSPALPLQLITIESSPLWGPSSCDWEGCASTFRVHQGAPFSSREEDFEECFTRPKCTHCSLRKNYCFAGHFHSLGTRFGGRQKITGSHKPLYENNRGVSLRAAAGSTSYYQGWKHDSQIYPFAVSSKALLCS